MSPPTAHLQLEIEIASDSVRSRYRAAQGTELARQLRGRFRRAL